MAVAYDEAVGRIEIGKGGPFGATRCRYWKEVHLGDDMRSSVGQDLESVTFSPYLTTSHFYVTLFHDATPYAYH